METAKTHSRIDEIDMAKGIGILLIVFGHAFNRLPEAENLVIFFNSFKMPLFFVLSGLVMTIPTVSSSLRNKVLSPERRLLVTYLICSAVFLYLDGLRFLRGDCSGYTLKTSIFKAITGFGIHTLWYLGTLLFSKILSRFLLAVIPSKWAQGSLTLALLIGGGALCAVLHQKQPFQETYKTWSLALLCRTVAASGFIMLGVNARKFVEGYIFSGKLHAAVKILIGCCLLSVNALLCGLAGCTDMRIANPGDLWLLNLALSVCGTCGILLLCSGLKRLAFMRKPLVFFGFHSLLIMVTHEYMDVKIYIDAIIAYFTDLNPQTLTHVLLQTGMLLAFEIVLCLCIGKPFLKALKNASTFSFKNIKQ